MSLYERWVLPRLTHLSMRQKQLAAYRARALAGARGRVLEIGIGSGLNLPFYGHGVQRVLGIDPSPELICLAEKAAGKESFPVEFLIQSAEEMPLERDSIDTAVTTWTLCTIPDPVKALQEVGRVLKPDGVLIFVEHGRAPEPKVVAWPLKGSAMSPACRPMPRAAELRSMGCVSLICATRVPLR